MVSHEDNRVEWVPLFPKYSLIAVRWFDRVESMGEAMLAPRWGGGRVGLKWILFDYWLLRGRGPGGGVGERKRRDDWQIFGPGHLLNDRPFIPIWFSYFLWAEEVEEEEGEEGDPGVCVCGHHGTCRHYNPL